MATVHLRPARGDEAGLLSELALRSKGHWGYDMEIEADPQAEAFYLAMGARRVGEVPSGSIPGRSLPLLEYPLSGQAAPGGSGHASRPAVRGTSRTSPPTR